MEQLPNRRNFLKGLAGAGAAALGGRSAEAHLNPNERLMPFPKDDIQRGLTDMARLEGEREAAEKRGDVEKAAQLSYDIKKLQKDIASLTKQWLENSAE